MGSADIILLEVLARFLLTWLGIDRVIARPLARWSRRFLVARNRRQIGEFRRQVSALEPHRVLDFLVSSNRSP